MSRKMQTILWIILSIILINNPVLAKDFAIEVKRPREKEEVNKEFDAKGKVIIGSKEETKSDMFLVSFIRPATWPKYYQQSTSKLSFREKNNKFEAEWTSHCWVGIPSDYGKKFYVYFFLMNKILLREIEEFNEKSGGEGISKVEFEDNFLDQPDKYFSKTEPIPIYRKFK